MLQSIHVTSSHLRLNFLMGFVQFDDLQTPILYAGIFFFIIIYVFRRFFFAWHFRDLQIVNADFSSNLFSRVLCLDVIYLIR